MAEDKTKRIRELIGTLRAAGRAYYQESREIMSNFEYDKLYDELVSLEKETGIVFANSPTQNVGYEVVSALPKERHEKPMLSLNKTKSVEELADWLGGQTGLLSWKMDGLTIVLTYQNGTLVKAVIKTKDILYIENRRYGALLVTKDAEYATGVRLKDWIAKTGQPDCFVYSHASYIVNLQNVIDFSKDSVTLRKGDGETVSVYMSQRKYPAFRKAFFNFAGGI